MKISILTIVHGHKKHLEDLLQGLNHSVNYFIYKNIDKDYFSEFEFEINIIHFNEEIYRMNLEDLTIKPSKLLKINQYNFYDFDTKLPLAKARNLALSKAKFENIIFLDIDCIANINFIESFIYFFNSSAAEHVAMGQVKYLTDYLGKLNLIDYQDKAWTIDLYRELERYSNFDQLRLNKFQEKITECTDYNLFESFSFALKKSTSNKIHGFNEKFKGYGAEDLDFSYRLKEKGIKLYWLNNSKAYHQYYDSQKLPIEHFDDIISKSLVFKDNWEAIPLQKCLKEFAKFAWIDYDANNIKILAKPE